MSLPRGAQDEQCKGQWGADHYLYDMNHFRAYQTQAAREAADAAAAGLPAPAPPWALPTLPARMALPAGGAAGPPAGQGEPAHLVIDARLKGAPRPGARLYTVASTA